MSSSLRHRAAPDAKRHPSGSHATAAPATGGVAVATATATATTTTAPTTVMAPHGLPVASVAPAAALGEERQPCSGAASAGGNDARKVISKRGLTPLELPAHHQAPATCEPVDNLLESTVASLTGLQGSSSHQYSSRSIYVFGGAEVGDSHAGEDPQRKRKGVSMSVRRRQALWGLAMMGSILLTVTLGSALVGLPHGHQSGRVDRRPFQEPSVTRAARPAHSNHIPFVGHVSSSEPLRVGQQVNDNEIVVGDKDVKVLAERFAGVNQHVVALETMYSLASKASPKKERADTQHDKTTDADVKPGDVDMDLVYINMANAMRANFPALPPRNQTRASSDESSAVRGSNAVDSSNDSHPVDDMNDEVSSQQDQDSLPAGVGNPSQGKEKAHESIEQFIDTERERKKIEKKEARQKTQELKKQYRQASDEYFKEFEEQCVEDATSDWAVHVASGYDAARFGDQIGFYKLPIRVDVARLQEETNMLTMNNSMAAFVHREQEFRTAKKGEGQSDESAPKTFNYYHLLITSEGGDNEVKRGPFEEFQGRLQRVPYIRQLLDSFEVPVSRSRFMRVEPGEQVNPHTDNKNHLSCLRGPRFAEFEEEVKHVRPDVKTLKCLGIANGSLKKLRKWLDDEAIEFKGDVRNGFWGRRWRLHIPVFTDEHVVMKAKLRVNQNRNDEGGSGLDSHDDHPRGQGELKTFHATMRAGEVWLLNNEVVHSVENNSPNARVHLVFDTVGGSKMFSLLENAETIPPRAGPGSELPAHGSADESGAYEDGASDVMIAPPIREIVYDPHVGPDVQLILEKWVDSPAFVPMESWDYPWYICSRLDGCSNAADSSEGLGALLAQHKAAWDEAVARVRSRPWTKVLAPELSASKAPLGDEDDDLSIMQQRQHPPIQLRNRADIQELQELQRRFHMELLYFDCQERRNGRSTQLAGSSLTAVAALEMFYRRMLLFTCTGVIPGVATGPPCLSSARFQ